MNHGHASSFSSTSPEAFDDVQRTHQNNTRLVSGQQNTRTTITSTLMPSMERVEDKHFHRSRVDSSSVTPRTSTERVDVSGDSSSVASRTSTKCVDVSGDSSSVTPRTSTECLKASGDSSSVTPRTSIACVEAPGGSSFTTLLATQTEFIPSFGHSSSVTPLWSAECGKASPRACFEDHEGGHLRDECANSDSAPRNYRASTTRSPAATPYARGASDSNTARDDAYSIAERRFRAQHSPHVGLLRPPTSPNMFLEVMNDTTQNKPAAERIFKVKGALDGVFMLPNFLNAEEQVEVANIIAQLAPLAKRNSDVFHKTRWMSLGVHYDWGKRMYVPNATCPLPERLKTMSAQVAQLCCLPTFTPDAALVNFYHPCQRPSDRLGGHKDDVENHMDQPLVALSLGPPCCFLLGGATRNDEPLPLLIRGGDVLVMSGPSRHAFHGVPKVWPFEESRKRKRTPMKEFPSGKELIAHTRVNISLRQV